MGAFAGLMNHQMTAGQALTGNSANPLAASTAGTSPASSTSSTGSSSATISANDFLTLLVTEMQNQDPTAQTDPNEYINQLVQVNSLEQLIDINQNLSAVLGAATAPPASGSTSAPASSNQNPSGQAAPSASGLAARGLHPNAHGGAAAHKAGGVTGAHSGGPSNEGFRTGGFRPGGSGAGKPRPGGSGTAAAISKFAQSAGARGAPGNLSIPKAEPAAHRVAHALDGHSHGQSIPGKLPGA